jgi:P4 family phage/plasmid primase-like protien
MNKTMAFQQYEDLNEFLAKHSTKNSKENTGYTHTRIPDKTLNIYPGSYTIPNEELPTFYSLYYTKIFEKKQNEYLTERQLDTGGPMAVDFDFRYNHSVTKRQHTRDHIDDMVCEYLQFIRDNCYTMLPNVPFFVYIFEKPNVNRLDDGSLTKDGIHMIIGLQIDHTMQLIIREKMIEKLAEVLQELPLINTWDSVLDEGISSGKTGWQLFGSKKPGNQAYELTRYYRVTIDEADNEFIYDEKDVKLFDLKSNFEKLSVRYDKNPKFEINPKILPEYNSRLQIRGKKPVVKASSKVKMNLIIEDDESGDSYVSIHDIKDMETLDKAILLFKNSLKTSEYEIIELHDFTLALPEKYYQPGSHVLNRQVAFALKSTDERLFLTWVKLRSKSSDFDYNTIPELHELWKKFKKMNNEGSKVTKKSIMYWLRKDNFEEYERIKKNTVDYYLELAFETATEYDLAMVLKQMYKEIYVCINVDKKGIWHRFSNHRWIQDKGLGLRNKISEELYSIITEKANQINEDVLNFGENDERREFLKKKAKKILDIRMRLKKTGDKNNIMREAGEIFYDEEFVKNMDTNKYLMCFKNGVVDFKNKIFREGYPEDYITKTTKIDYIPYQDITIESSPYNEVKKEINDFMSKLFPEESLKKYMFDHLSSCLIGANKNQTFNVYHGSGSNGKSILADLMSLTLGEYKGTVPITLVTDSRGKIGGTSDEVLKLKGVRYAVMQEPTKGVKLNEGIMKELTGGDPLQARGLYSESETFEPQFNLVVCTNSLFDIESNDDGTWRRIRKCDFKSKFVNEGETYNDETQFTFVKDRNLKDKLPQFAPVFASMLVNRAYETDGIVEDCDIVLQASNKYRNAQDHITAFIEEMIIVTDDTKDVITKKGLMQGFKQWFEINLGSRKVPKAEEVYEAMNKKKVKISKDNKWHSVKFREPETEDNDEE